MQKPAIRCGVSGHRLTSLSRSIDFAQESGWITEADLGGVAMMMTYAGLMDNSDQHDPMIVKWGAELTKLMDKYGLTLFGKSFVKFDAPYTSGIPVFFAIRLLSLTM